MKWPFSNGTSGGWLRFSSAVCCFLLALAPAAQAAGSFDQVVTQARTAAAAPFQPNEFALPEVLRRLDYDSYRKITFRRERSLWRNADEPFRVQFFHPGYLFDHPVRIHEVVRGEIQEVRFSPKYYRYPELDPVSVAGDCTLGFAGLRILYPLNHRDRWDEVISFLGSSYFRALGAGQIYGISARGLAVNTGENFTEEFPAFREFWLVQPKSGARQMEFYALLDGPSVAGAYRFLLTPGADTQLEIEAHLFFREAVKALGIAPLTSMFWRGEDDSRPPNDKRSEVHDSDGLLIDRDGWHPLAPVTQVTTQRFPQKDATGFSLLQRDRDPAHYHDREAHYELRPSVRVEPLSDWGTGSIVLFRLPGAERIQRQRRRLLGAAKSAEGRR